jgi:hypothetical protein
MTPRRRAAHAPQPPPAALDEAARPLAQQLVALAVLILALPAVRLRLCHLLVAVAACERGGGAAVVVGAAPSMRRTVHARPQLSRLPPALPTPPHASPCSSASHTQSRSTATQRPAAATARASVLRAPSLPLALARPRTWLPGQVRVAAQGSAGPENEAVKSHCSPPSPRTLKRAVPPSTATADRLSSPSESTSSPMAAALARRPASSDMVGQTRWKRGGGTWGVASSAPRRDVGGGRGARESK